MINPETMINPENMIALLRLSANHLPLSDRISWIRRINLGSTYGSRASLIFMMHHDDAKYVLSKIE